jgi:hypothetical protein
MKQVSRLKVVVVDGQGGALGKSVIAAIKRMCSSCEVMAVGANSAATVAMLGAGADHGATGENPVVIACSDADVIVGPIGIIVSNSMFGEITPTMARAVGESRARKILIPVDKCSVMIVGTLPHPYAEYVKLAAEAVLAECTARLE